MGNQNKGITLIALIITIIILLILAGVTINLTLGENGLFNTAKQATDSYVKADMSEKLLIAIADLQAEKLGGAILEDITQEWINSKIQEYECRVIDNKEANNKIITMKKDNVVGIFIIDEKLNIVECKGKTVWFYDIIERNGNDIKISISIFDDRGISKIEFPGQSAVSYDNQKGITGIEYTVQRKVEYIVKLTLADGKEEELKIRVNDYYKVILNLPEGINIDNEVQKIEHGDTYTATVSVQDDKYFLDSLKATMGGTTITDLSKVNVATRKDSYSKCFRRYRNNGNKKYRYLYCKRWKINT